MKKHFLIGTTLSLLTLIFAPAVASAQSYVPVQDIRLNPAFNTFSNNFNTYANDMRQALTQAPDSLRDIIAGPNPQGVAAQACRRGNAEDEAFAYGRGSTDQTGWGPWMHASASSSGSIPDQIPAGGGYVQVNTSKSIRCLLEELNSYQKTSLYVQFHGLLKQYIADAQQKELSNQLLNQINAANLNWAKGGVQINNGGVLTSEPVYITNVNTNIYSRNERTLNHIVNQAAAAPGDPIGSLESCEPTAVAQQIAKSERALAEDRFNYTTSETQCTRTAPSGPFANNADIDEYMEDPNTPRAPGSLFMLGYGLNTPNDMPRTAIDQVQNEAARRIEQAESNYKLSLGGDDMQGAYTCSGGADDPFCVPDLMINVTPKKQTGETVVSANESGKKQLQDANTLDAGAANAAETLSTEANTQPAGVLGYDTTGLSTTQTAANRLIQELYDSIQYAYFDLDADEENWAEAALLNIYDEMSFDQANPNVVVPVNQAPTPVNI